MRRLGISIATNEPFDTETERTLAAYLGHYGLLTQHLLGEADHLLRTSSFPVPAQITSRLKSWPTVVAKLEKGFTLDVIRDLVGVRVVLLDGGRREQDMAVDCLVNAYQGAKVIDRRADPRSGYRAVHLEVKVDGARAEIQVRTALQHQWAEVSELVADRWGRDLRYGTIPPDLNELQQMVWSTILRVSESVDAVESVHHRFATMSTAGKIRAVLRDPRGVLLRGRSPRLLHGALKELSALVGPVTEASTPDAGSVSP